ncbi:protein-glutamate methylesterase/protein-glutamine glutaminase [Marinobacterium jannaschii]|uniref:protein-glutamate methylesterase/protein-glutamine glutaminase n=1 Tax=Marinobacterium jannaschii TaxID=64970 RepID=UPI0004874E46|nr:chemotaxis response regulator protein-glutamate methylesterase [Marinobacterium jannaschii]
MPVKVLIVDDSGFFRHRIADLLSSDRRIEVIGSASNGIEAVEKVKQLKPDVVTMDVEMPQMNGIEAVRIIMRENPTHVLMLSSLTHEGARVTLDALDAGAVDFLSKDMRAWMDKNDSLKTQLCDKVVEISRFRASSRRGLFAGRPGSEAATGTTMVFRPQQREKAVPLAAGKATSRPAPAASVAPRGTNAPVSAPAPAHAVARPLRRPRVNCDLMVIGSSTGGPAALQQILTQLPANFPYPILLVQHMPGTFTSVFAQRLNQQCAIEVREARDGDQIKPGLALLAPGGHQMILDGRRSSRVRVLPGDERLTYKPSVDVTYGSSAKSHGSRVLALILTGMGADGCEGAKMLKRCGATVWAQNKESSTIFGMPQAVINAGLADEILDLQEIGPILSRMGAR